MTKKNIGRIQEAEIKKQLRKFAKKEFTEKKPLEIRVLHLKPGVVFKKGSMLPNLMIKNLIGSAYVVYLDYGDQLKFYYFAKNGMSMGSRNFDKSEKILKEMHGKAKTILKLPKIVKIVGLDEENKEIRKYWKKLSDKYSHRFLVSRKKLPAISIKKNMENHNIRIGIQQNKEILHFNYDYFNTDFQEIILLRELFPIFTHLSKKDEIIQMISTIWALTLNSFQDYIQTLNKIPTQKDIIIKSIQWLENIFMPFIASDSKSKKEIAHLLLTSCTIINKDDLIVFHDFWDLFLLWFIEKGIKKYSQFFNSDWKFWLFFEMLEFFYNEKDLCQKFGINNHGDEFLPLIHLCSRFVVDKESDIDKKQMNTVVPNYSKIEKSLENFRYSEFLSLIPEPIISINNNFIEYALLTLLTQKGLVAECEDFINMAINTERKIEISVKNRTDWKLENIRFQWDIVPEKGINVQRTDIEKIPVFENDLKFNFEIKSSNRVGKHKLNIFMYYKNPINQNSIQSSLIKKIEIDIQ
jgi:hypothetical protein